MHDIVSGSISRLSGYRGKARRRTPASWRAGIEERVKDKLTRLRREIIRLDDEIRFEPSRRHPKIERVIELRERERQRAEEVQTLARALRGGTATTPPPLHA